MTSLPTPTTRRRFLQQASLASLAGSMAGRMPAAETRQDAFSFLLLGDLHFDRMEHHDLEWLKEFKQGDLSQIENYSRLTREVTPALFSTLRETMGELNADAAKRAAFVLQVGDLVQGLCGSEELAALQNREAVEFLDKQLPNTPFLFTKGNHDVTGEGSREAFASVFHPYLTRQVRSLKAEAETVQSARYTVEQGGALFCFFDAYDKESLAWLEAVLEKRTARHCFVIIHPPVVPYGARSTWHLYAREDQRMQREKLLALLGRNEAIVLGGHIHKFNAMERATPGGGRFVQLALSSIMKGPDPEPKDLLSGMEAYTGDQVKLEPRFSPETEAERRAVYDRERSQVKSYAYADLPGYAVIRVDGARVSADMYAGTTRRLWRTVELAGG
ncbi:metallophosphoesterase [Prosthecobacter sp. SYSU 5D2]|uniref:metallophosphoesterase family protein n=1 Tax=Prosthecobacter sp. SYSU 5D2 TaxID=3134134 RepID=UPI0031FEC5D5